MVPAELKVGGRRLRFAVSDNEKACGPEGPGSPPIWAANIHGYFAGGSMYWRESARLAQRMGWRVVNPSLPGFGGSDPLDWGEVSMAALSEQVALILEHLDAGPVVMIGHSMGGAVAVRYAYDHFDETLGIIYRDGVATPGWKQRRGVFPMLLAGLAPDLAPTVDMLAAVVLDTPDLFIGHLSSTLRSLLPDVQRNLQTMGKALPVGSMLMTVDLSSEVRHLARRRLPLLAEWGCFDRVAGGQTPEEFADCSHTKIQWVPGGHSWMLARPQGQADVLSYLPRGRVFVEQVTRRWRQASSDRRSLRAIG